MSLFFDLSLKFEFNASERERLYIKLSQLMRNGVSLNVALEQIEKIASRKRGSALPKLYGIWRKNISNGDNFGQCLAPFVPSSEAILLETGANSGKLLDALENAADAIKQQSKVKKAIIAAAAYPAVLTAMLIASMVLSAFKVIPTFEEIIPLEEWQGIALYVALSARFIRDYGLVLLACTLVAVIIVSASLPRWTGPIRISFDNIVPWSLYRMWQGSSFLLAVSSLMAAGVKLDDTSLARIAKKADPYLSERIQGIARQISAGENLGDALHNAGFKFPDEDIIADLQVYAKLRKFEDNLIMITRTWVDSLVERVTITMKIVNTLILVLIAIVIGCLISAFYGVFQQIQASSRG